MTSKERVIMTINHQEPDRLPIGEWGIDHDHVEKILNKDISLWRNRKLQTIYQWENRHDEMRDIMIDDYEKLLDILDYDILTIDLFPSQPRHPQPIPREISQGTWEDNRGRIFKYAASNDSIECLSHNPEKETLTLEELNDIAKAMAQPFDPSIFSILDYFSKKYADEKAILCRGVDVFNILMGPFGGDFSHQLILPMTHGDEIKKIYPYALNRQKRLFRELKKRGVLIAMEGKDFCMNSGPMFTPDSLREVFFPFQKSITEELKAAGIIPFFHCCGNTWEILDDFVDAGWSGYQSVQKSAGMDWKKLKREYGEKLTIWAGISCETLVEGSLADVETEVSNGLIDLSEGGGFIFGSTNSVQYGANTDNYLYALELARKFKY